MKMINYESIFEKFWYIGVEGVVNSVFFFLKVWLCNEIFFGEDLLYS